MIVAVPIAIMSLTILLITSINSDINGRTYIDDKK